MFLSKVKTSGAFVLGLALLLGAADLFISPVPAAKDHTEERQPLRPDPVWSK